MGSVCLLPAAHLLLKVSLNLIVTVPGEASLGDTNTYCMPARPSLWDGRNYSIARAPTPLDKGTGSCAFDYFQVHQCTIPNLGNKNICGHGSGQRQHETAENSLTNH